ncbi:DUF2827 family protein [Paraburkholderia sediminicola]|uniref:DUF2827 family protein n=1 Tax=Paraburkholderia sediminicola TaxID=458836 RepID=UPI0038B6D97E
MRNAKTLKIGVTAFIQSGQSLWLNGIIQNAVFLVRLLANASAQYDVFLANTNETPSDNASLWPPDYVNVRNINSAIDEIDVLILVGSQLPADMCAYVRRKGGKVVSYCCASEYVLSMQASIFRHPIRENVYVNTEVDAIWIVPQVADTSFSYYQVLYRAPARIVPFVWDPTLLEFASTTLPNKGIYVGNDGPARAICMEPNIGVSKYCLYPIFIAELAYRQNPNLFGTMRVTNTTHLRTDIEFVGLMSNLDIVRDGKCSFEDRFDTIPFINKYGDVVISHQWDNPLNYFYLEVAWQGYPLVHNAHLCSEIGFYYPRSNISAGSSALLQAIKTNDTPAKMDAFRKNQRAYLDRFCVWNNSLQESYCTLLNELMIA